ncbi:MAG: FixH family protein [Spongiibacteraceae bacterium]
MPTSNSVTHTKTNAVNNAEPVKPWHRHFWPWFIIALLGTVVVASFITLGIAIHFDDSVVRDNYYKEGLAINQEKKLDERARAANISAQMTIEQQGIRLDLRGELAQHASQMMLQFIHPLHADNDLTVTLTEVIDGTFIGNLPRPLHGHWVIDLQPAPTSTWRLRSRIDLDSSKTFSLQP